MKGHAGIFEQMWRSSEKECDDLWTEIMQLRTENERLKAEAKAYRRIAAEHLNEIEQLRAEIKQLHATLKGIEIYSSSHDDARGMAAKAQEKKK